MTTQPKGTKHDQGKDRWDLVPVQVLEDLVKVLTYGAEKYSDNNWQKVENPDNRYFAAAMRHLMDWRKGQELDEESGLPNLGHAMACLVFLRWFEKNRTVKTGNAYV